jgi:hypothetical protein
MYAQVMADQAKERKAKLDEEDEERRRKLWSRGKAVARSKDRTVGATPELRRGECNMYERGLFEIKAVFVTNEDGSHAACKGQGVVYVGDEPIPAGVDILEYTGEIRDAEHSKALEEEDEQNSYVFVMKDGPEGTNGSTVDGTKGGLTQFVNHGFWVEDPNGSIEGVINCEM